MVSKHPDKSSNQRRGRRKAWYVMVAGNRFCGPFTVEGDADASCMRCRRDGYAAYVEVATNPNNPNNPSTGAAYAGETRGPQ